MKFISSLLLSLSIASFVHAQKIDQTTRNFDGAPPSSVTSEKSGGNQELVLLTQGAQRPIFRYEKVSALSAMMLR